jgi:hypothetical protein
MESNFDKGKKDMSNRLRNLIIIPEKIREFRQELNQKFSNGEITKSEFDEASAYLDKKEDEHYSKTPGLREVINEVFSQIVEKKLCPAGKAYAERRKKPKSEGGGGEKHSAYLMGRAVKVCKRRVKG